MGRIKEICKTLIIILLLLSLALLSLTAVSFSGAEIPFLNVLAGRLRGEAEQPPIKAQELALTDAAVPMLISMRTEAGRTSFWGAQGEQGGVYEILGGYLAEALDTAGEPSPAEASALEKAAAGDSLLFRFPGELPLSVLAAWMDASCDTELTANLFLLEVRENEVRLFLDGQSGCFVMDTRAAAAPLLRALRSYPDDGTRLAAETGDEVYSRLDPLTLVDPSAVSTPAAHSANPCDESFLTAAAESLGFNPYGDASYRDGAGGLVFTEADCSMRADADGVLFLRNQSPNGRFRAAGSDDGACIEYVRAMLENISAGALGDASLQFTGIRHEGGQTTVEFNYVLAGLPVIQSGGAAAEAHFNGAALTELRFRIRAYTLIQTEQIALLPPAQTAAVLEDGASLRLSYADQGEEKLNAGWLRRDG